jgi:hypothetical protein
LTVVSCPHAEQKRGLVPPKGSKQLGQTSGGTLIGRNGSASQQVGRGEIPAAANTVKVGVSARATPRRSAFDPTLDSMASALSGQGGSAASQWDMSRPCRKPVILAG